MKLNDHDHNYARNEESDQVDVVFVDDDTLVTQHWCVLDASLELPGPAPADCEGLEGGLGI